MERGIQHNDLLGGSSDVGEDSKGNTPGETPEKHAGKAVKGVQE